MLTRTLQPASPVRNRVFLILLIALFIAPLLGAWLLVGHWRPGSTSNHGELLNPARPIAHLRVQQPNGDPLDERYLQDRWTLIYINPVSGCDSHCQDSLYKIRQLRLALGKDRGRVQRLFMMADMPTTNLLGWLSKEHGDMPVGIADAPTLQFLNRAFSESALSEDWFYLVDPLGNLVMRYRTQSNPRDILDDLEHLLKFSRIG